MTRHVTKAEVARLVAMFEATDKKHGRSIAVETIVTEARFTAVDTTAALMVAGVRQIVSRLADVYGVRLTDVYAHVRSRVIDRCRCEAYWTIKQLNYSYPEVGRFFGRDHTTIISGCRAFERRMAVEPMLRRRVGPRRASVAVVARRAA